MSPPRRSGSTYLFWWKMGRGKFIQLGRGGYFTFQFHTQWKNVKNFYKGLRIRHHTLSPLHFYTRARGEPLINTHGVYKQKTVWFKSKETGYWERALHPPPFGENKWGAWARVGCNKIEAVGADRRRSRHVITLISKNSGIDYFFFLWFACFIEGINFLFVKPS